MKTVIPLLVAIAFGIAARLTWSVPWWADVTVSLLV